MVDSGAITRITLVHFPVRCRGGGWGGLGGRGKELSGTKWFANSARSSLRHSGGRHAIDHVSWKLHFRHYC